jgi:hypothetical protein
MMDENDRKYLSLINNASNPTVAEGLKRILTNSIVAKVGASIVEIGAKIGIHSLSLLGALLCANFACGKVIVKLDSDKFDLAIDQVLAEMSCKTLCIT